jgi:hypothetical protein
MPWNNPNDFAFDENEIIDHAPATTGVVYLHDSKKVLYVVATPNIKLSLLDLLNAKTPSRVDRGPLWFSYERMDTMKHAAERTRELNAELNPMCNGEII